MDVVRDMGFGREEESLEEDGDEDFAVTLRIHESLTPDPQEVGGGGEMLLDLEGIPCIAVTPMTPPSGTVSPDGHSTVSLNSSMGSPLFQRKEVGGVLANGSGGGDLGGGGSSSGGGITTASNVWRGRSESQEEDVIIETEAKDFFAYRDSILQHVVGEVERATTAGTTIVGGGGSATKTEEMIRGTWLLTEIDFWNNEWERLVVLTERAIVVFKYDFIGMKVEDMRRIELGVIDKVIQGELVYPQKSLTPKLNGLAEGIAGVVKDCIIPTVHGTVQTVSGAVWRKGRCGVQLETGVEATEDLEKNTVNGSASRSESQESPNESNGENGNGTTSRSLKGSIMSILSLDKFEAKPRNAHGIQMIWNEHQPLSLYQKWNPFDKSIPRVTFTCHPLFYHKGGGESVGLFDVDCFSRELVQVLSHGGGDVSPSCRIEYKPIVIESYVGITSLLHNANSLGFYKVRGKVSF